MLAKDTPQFIEWLFILPKVTVGQSMDKDNKARRIVFWRSTR